MVKENKRGGMPDSKMEPKSKRANSLTGRSWVSIQFTSRKVVLCW